MVVKVQEKKQGQAGPKAVTTHLRGYLMKPIVKLRSNTQNILLLKYFRAKYSSKMGSSLVLQPTQEAFQGTLMEGRADGLYKVWMV